MARKKRIEKLAEEEIDNLDFLAADINIDDLVSFDDDIVEADYDINTNERLESPISHIVKNKTRTSLLDLRDFVLDQIIDRIPEPDETMFIVTNGRGADKRNAHGKTDSFEFGQFVAYLIRLMNITQARVYISTWSMSFDHAVLILDLIDTGMVKQMSILCDPSFKGRKPHIYATLVDGLLRRQQRYKGIKNHAKILLIADEAETQTLTVFGSANLSSLPRSENFTLSSDRALYELMRDEYFEAVFNSRNNRKWEK